MKFSDIDQQTWLENATYFDTCLLPITGLTGKESPFETTIQLVELQNIIDQVEKHFKGRIVIYPAFHYLGDATKDFLNQVISQMKAQSFKYVIIVSDALSIHEMSEFAGDCKFSSKKMELNDAYIKDQILALWQKDND